MSEVLAPAPTSQPPSGSNVFVRFWGILVSPRAAFTDVTARPRWFGMMALVIIVSCVLTGGFLSTKIGQQAYLDQAVRSAEMWSKQPVTDAQYAMYEKLAKYAGAMFAGQIILFSPIMTLIIAGILFAVFNAALGGDSSFKQLFTVIVHAGAVSVVQQVFVTPLNYVRESMSSATNLAVFLPMLDEGSFMAKLLGTVDLFLVWYVIVLATGLSVLYKRKTGPIATALFVVYGIIAVIIAAVTSGRAGA
jgi:hypothetical protein